MISLAVLPFDTLLVAITKKHIRNLSKRIAERSAEMSAKTYESLSGIRTVQALGVERIFFNKIFEIFKEVSNLRLKLSLVQNGSGFAANLFKARGVWPMAGMDGPRFYKAICRWEASWRFPDMSDFSTDP